MSVNTNFHDIAPYVCAPTVRSRVRAYIKQLNTSFLLREIWKPLGIPRNHVCRELDRMRKKGLLTRHLIQANEVNNLHNVPQTRMLYLYTPTELIE